MNSKYEFREENYTKEETAAIMRDLYETDTRFSQEAIEITTKSIAAISGIFTDAVKKGYTIRQVSYTIQNAVRDLELELLLELQYPKEVN